MATKVARDPWRDVMEAPPDEEQNVPKLKATDPFADPRGKLLTPRFVVSVLLMLLGIAWIAYYYTAVRAEPPLPPDGKPKFMADLEDWNYLIGFGAFFLGLILAAHPSTPLGRGRGVVVGMLGCFLLGLLWICTFYVISDDPSRVWVFNDLGQKNLFVGIAFMAVGFTYATRWE
ncbi:cell division protein CrgA [Nocardioides sp. cx-173]|uniref:cell division protein CrgA n=1 Tax=Nocardioides sp. cx-173 TaxID=2898796 RepID=UPI001E29D915|nr:cell division protein CrgA [Nocardioides sp. cx-173]MCD4523688.1 cell division protein CrgA [Nocardioides sp. cx-173]UGB41982.1 cell division protein CrgA [Nocardioides sp. cx-173]